MRDAENPEPARPSAPASRVDHGALGGISEERQRPTGAEEGTGEQPDEFWEDEPGIGVEGWCWWVWVAFALSLAGFGDALYLTIDHFRGAVPICAANGVIDCAKVTTSGESYLFHMPVALLGLVFFSLLSLVNSPPMWGGRAPWWLAYARLILVVGGMVDVIWLLYSELFTIKAICLWCTGIHAITFVLFVLVVATFPTVSTAAQYEGD